MDGFAVRKKIEKRVVIIILAGLLITIILLMYWRVILLKEAEVKPADYSSYKYHYVMIADKGNSTFWDDVYDGARRNGNAKQAYVERMGEDIAVPYTKNEMLDIAIASKVDGIILEGDGSTEQKNMINKAENAGIPVVTMLNDNYGSNRRAFIGIANYELGREDARQGIKIATKSMKRVTFLMDQTEEGAGKNLILSGYKETMENEGNHLNLTTEVISITDQDSFSSQETIRNIFLNKKELPDIIICTNETGTIHTYQTIVDYNMVGQVKIIGYYASETILNAIQKKIISSSIVFDAKEMGALCVEALNEYKQTGYVNDYITLDADIVNSENCEGYLDEK